MEKIYRIPTESLEVVTEIKKSRFIARAELVNDRDAAMLMLAQAKIDYPDARHHCWAYLVGNPKAASNAAMNDGGEPNGTAGKPILNVIQHKMIGDVMVVVIRYFGGIKLGAGGLTRAYSGAAESVLSQLKTIKLIPMQLRMLQCNFSQEQLVRHWAGLHDAKILEIDYEQVVNLKIQLPDVVLIKLQAFCAANGIILFANE